jgi:hypothetical protein
MNTKPARCFVELFVFIRVSPLAQTVAAAERRRRRQAWAGLRRSKN